MEIKKQFKFSIKKKLMCKLTTEELAERGGEQSSLLLGIGTLEAERARINAAIKPKKERVQELAIIIDAEVEEREVSCSWEYDYTKGLRHLFRDDTGEHIETDLIPLNDPHNEPTLPFVEVKEEVGIFAGCPENEGGCPFFKTGNACAPPLCGKNLPALQTVTVDICCRHPQEDRIVESNAVICGICKTVLETSEIVRDLQPVEEEKDPCEGCDTGECPGGRQCEKYAAGFRVDVASGSDIAVGVTFENGVITATEELEPGRVTMLETPDPKPLTFMGEINKERQCCLPKDRAFIDQGATRILYCKICGLVTAKQDLSTVPYRSIPFVCGETVDLKQVAI